MHKKVLRTAKVLIIVDVDIVCYWLLYGGAIFMSDGATLLDEAICELRLKRCLCDLRVARGIERVSVCSLQSDKSKHCLVKEIESTNAALINSPRPIRIKGKGTDEYKGNNCCSMYEILLQTTCFVPLMYTAVV